MRTTRSERERICGELGMQLRDKVPKRRVKAKLRDDRREAVHPNDVWAMDFVHDQLPTGKQVRILTIVDTFSRYFPALDASFGDRAEDGVRTLEQICPEIGYPSTIRFDQGSEFVSRDLGLWAYAKGVTLEFSRPGMPTDNAYIRAVKGLLRADYLNARWFQTLADAAEKLEAWGFPVVNNTAGWPGQIIRSVDRDLMADRAMLVFVVSRQSH